MQFSDSMFASRFQITRQDLEKYLWEALSQGGDYAGIKFAAVDVPCELTSDAPWACGF